MDGLKGDQRMGVYVGLRAMCRWLLVSRYARGHVDATVWPFKLLTWAVQKLAVQQRSPLLNFYSKETADFWICFRIIVGLFFPGMQPPNAVDKLTW